MKRAGLFEEVSRGGDALLSAAGLETPEARAKLAGKAGGAVVGVVVKHLVDHVMPAKDEKPSVAEEMKSVVLGVAIERTGARVIQAMKRALGIEDPAKTATKTLAQIPPDSAEAWDMYCDAYPEPITLPDEKN